MGIFDNIKTRIDGLIPHEAILPLVLCFAYNCFVYFIPRLFLTNVKHYDFTTDLDRSVPFAPGWISIYLVCYLFWIFNYILVGRGPKEDLYRFAAAEILAKTICGIFFILLPTTNIRPEVIGNDLWSQLTRLVYAADEATNLFPSIHCLVSWFCFMGIRKRSDIPSWYKGFSFVFAILVFCSTQFTKQHYLVDIAGGVMIAELCYAIGMHTKLYRPLERICNYINRKVWHDHELQ